MDEEQVQTPAENTDAPAQGVTDSPAVEPADATPADAPEDQNNGNQEEQKPRNNAENRLKEVLGERKQLRQEIGDLRGLLEQASRTQVPDNISDDEYRALMASATVTSVEVNQLKRELAAERFSKEVDAVEQDFPELNPKSDQYNEKLADRLAQAYQEGHIEVDGKGNFIRARKSLREFTEQMIEPYREAITKGASQTRDALNTQAGEAVVTPQTTSSSEPKAFKDKSISEMEKELGFHRG